MNLIFPQNWHFLSFCRSKHNYHLQVKSKELFRYSNPFESCLIVKNCNPRKWLILIQYIYTYNLLYNLLHYYPTCSPWKWEHNVAKHNSCFLVDTLHTTKTTSILVLSNILSVPMILTMRDVNKSFSNS